MELEKQVRELLEVMDELENSGYYDYGQWQKLVDKQNELLEIINSMIGR